MDSESVSPVGSLWTFVRRVLFLFDPEQVHRGVVYLIRRSPRMVLRRLSGASERTPHLLTDSPWGLPFRSRLGLAAGFDKDGELIDRLPDLGFGFAEIGTVTPRPQAGNPRPRLFRAVERQALFNRMGFNGLGAFEVASHLEGARERLRSPFVVGVNLGKNKDTPADLAARDYATAATPFEGLADYLVINVSSPNTPGLRSLQAWENLQPIVAAVQEVIGRWTKVPPLLLKLAPELEQKDLELLIPRCDAAGVQGWVLTNTLAGIFAGGPGGWSGAPLREQSVRALRVVRGLTSRPIISVGGILTASDVRERRKLGADLIQVYSGWVFGGPRFPSQIAAGFEEP